MLECVFAPIRLGQLAMLKRHAVDFKDALLAVVLSTASLSPVSAEGMKSDSNPGEPVNGLQVMVIDARTTWAVGAVMDFDATLKNVGDHPFLVDVFGDLDEVYQGKHTSEYVTSCWALSWEQALGVGVMKGRILLDPTQFVYLQPGESYTKRLSLRLSAFPLGKYRVRIAYVPRSASPSFGFPKGWREERLPPVPIWIGMAFSNGLAVEVVGAPQAFMQKTR